MNPLSSKGKEVKQGQGTGGRATSGTPTSGTQKYKTIKHYHEPGDFHELTFSCFHRMPLLTNDRWRRMLSVAIERAMAGWEFRLCGFVYMPEHVHLLVYPVSATSGTGGQATSATQSLGRVPSATQSLGRATTGSPTPLQGTGGQATSATQSLGRVPSATPRVDGLLKAIKRPYSFRIKKLLEAAKSPLLQRLTIRERPGVTVFRYWQEGPGYDRNLQTVKAVLASLDYIHMNPVRQGLCQRAEQWKWSSARFYLSDGQVIDTDLPTIHRIPAEFLQGATG